MTSAAFSPVQPTTLLYDRWTSRRTLRSLGTNDGAQPIAFQKWHHFKEAFAPELIYRAISESHHPVERCLDPFGGSGTTALTCRMLGVSSHTTEVNPFLADVIRAKLTDYNPDRLVQLLTAIRGVVRTTLRGVTIPTELPPTFVEPGLDERWIYGRSAAMGVFGVLAAIELVCKDDSESERLFRMLLGGMLVDVSNVSVTGKGRRYRRKWTERMITAEEVVCIFVDRAEAAIVEIASFSARPHVNWQVDNADARIVDFGQDCFDLSVFSPPYPNSFDYTDVYNLQLWVLGYLRDWPANQELRRATLTSHVQISRAYVAAPIGSPILSSTLRALEDQRDQLWDRNIPAMVGAYFSDLLGVTMSAVTSLRAGGQAWVVVGDSKYRGVHVPVASILSELLASHHSGLSVDVEPIRHMKSSAQQGLTSDLAESLLRIQKS